MKGLYSYNIFIEKLLLIYSTHYQTVQHITISNNYIPEIHIQKHQNRRIKEKPSITKTVKQIKEEVRQRKQNQRNEIKERLDHAKYKEITKMKRSNSILYL